MCADYIEAHPPDSWSLRDLGAKLPEFLRVTPPFAVDALACDLARYEWAFVDAFDAPDAPPLDTAAIAAATEEDWSRARLELAPSVQLVRAGFPVDELRAAVQKGESPERPAAKDVYLVVWRGPDAMKYSTWSRRRWRCSSVWRRASRWRARAKRFPPTSRPSKRRSARGSSSGRSSGGSRA